MSHFDRHMRRQGLMPSTQDKYTTIVSEAHNAGADGPEIVDWLERKLHARVPIGTVLPMRAAVKHYLVSELGFTPEEAQDMLPKAKGVPSRVRDALNVRQLALYYTAIEGVPEPNRTILMLLPPTGMRIGEITRLAKSEIERRGDRWQFRFQGKGGRERKVPLNSASVRALERYFDKYGPKGPWVFPTTQLGLPVSPHTVRKYTRKIAAAYPRDLPALSPHVLRHTAASLWLKQGKDLKTVQTLLGHKNIATTSRYLHPDDEMLQDAVDSFDKLMPM